MNNISEHITYQEATFSDKAVELGLENIPNDEQLKAMKMVADRIFEAVRANFGLPIKVDSFFRSPELNARIKGASTTSQHCAGEAIDMKAMGFSNAELFKFIRNNLQFDQLIWEFGSESEPQWVHCSYSQTHNRMSVLRSIHSGNKIVYVRLPLKAN